MPIIPSSALTAAAVPFLEDIYDRYQADPESVDPSWASVFRLADELAGVGGPGDADARWIANALRRFGHQMAATNPLSAPEEGALAMLREKATVAALEMPPSASALYEQYCGALSVESAHIDDEDVRQWIQEAFENAAPPNESTLRRVHEKLVQAEEFERFLGKKFPGKKRFGAEGATALVPLLDLLLKKAADEGIRHVVIGTMHRGRLNVLANVLAKPLDALMAQFKGAHPFGADSAESADVAYHFGLDTVLRETGLNVSLLPNPSHLEAVDPVVVGRVRALQDEQPDEERKRVLGIIVHTDAAVIGQGVVAELLQLGKPAGYCTGGTVHVVVNNQLGFTTEPNEGRTSRYCTGPWKAIDSLILHANADDAGAIVRAADLAIDFRNSQERDCVIDLVCYRRNGHNEMDEPRFTQPRLYRQIDAMNGARKRVETRLIEAGQLSQAEADDISARYRSSLERGYGAMPMWQPELETDVAAPRRVPVVKQEVLRRLLDEVAQIPQHVKVDAKLQRLVKQRGETTGGLQWATGEALALGSLLLENIPVRLSGQDVVRGAFSHRHFALTDVENGARHISLQHLAPGQAPFNVLNSPLSEYAVLGFEYGYSLGRRAALTIWEAQFGDFANGAQIVVDQFIASGEEKWRQTSSLIMLLPHGLEGQGPEHSSARLERFLQLTALDNIRVVVPTTPANYFHLLRQQAHDLQRKPLVIFSPKTLLRLPAAVSRIEDFSSADGFQPVIVSPPVDAETKIERVLFCTGKIAYALEEKRKQLAADNTLVVRLEQLYPLPESAISNEFRAYPDADLIWVQEEPANMGAWSWLDRRMEDLARDGGHRKPRMRYCGRLDATSPAGSFHERHGADQEAITTAAFA
ncbi:2-oxoglutarate dehydrogenase E1 component [Paraburkholderia strydomiana]|nr:2-oxoglutarate dehydrogenase E1 component [Paraburkholderia strydomiana]